MKVSNLITFASVLFIFSLNISFAQNASVSPEDYSTRQVHLDFHTSEDILGIGKKFDKKEWQGALKTANISSINIFAKGHHGWSYYKTEHGEMHPHLDFDLLKTQLDACHEIGIKAPFYFTIGWSELDGREHPEWIIKDKDGKSLYEKKTGHVKPGEPYPTFTWPLLMPEGDYLDLILKQTEELCKNYDVDGFWYDIIPTNSINYNEYSLNRMKKEDVDLDNFEAVNFHHIRKIKFFMASCNDIIKKYHPDASIFYNWSTHMTRSNTFDFHLYEYNTSHDLEDLPTTWQGYDVFAMRAKYFSNTGKPISGMSGKFHTAWGEFGGFKYPEGLKYEAASMVAFGANVNFGDQLHPSGQIDPETYNNLKYAFDYVEKIEEYGVGGKHVSHLGMWMTIDNEADQGVSQLLLETQTDYVVVNNLKDWSELEVIVIPSAAFVTDEIAKRFEAFQKQGGKLIILGEGIFKKDGSGLAFDIGAQYVGKAEFDIDYTVVTDQLSANVVKSPFLNYIPAWRFKPEENTEILANIREPYFSRTKEHFSSHQNTPYKLENADYPAIIKSGNVVYCAHSLDRMYKNNGARIHRELFNNALKLVYTDPMLEVNLPSAGRVNLLAFPDKNRYVAHVLYSPPLQRGLAQVIEDLVPIQNVEVALDVPQEFSKAYLIPDNIPLEMKTDGNKVTVFIPEFSCHAAVVFE